VTYNGKELPETTTITREAIEVDSVPFYKMVKTTKTGICIVKFTKKHNSKNKSRFYFFKERRR